MQQVFEAISFLSHFGHNLTAKHSEGRRRGGASNTQGGNIYKGLRRENDGPGRLCPTSVPEFKCWNASPAPCDGLGGEAFDRWPDEECRACIMQLVVLKRPQGNSLGKDSNKLVASNSETDPHRMPPPTPLSWTMALQNASSEFLL